MFTAATKAFVCWYAVIIAQIGSGVTAGFSADRGRLDIRLVLLEIVGM
jgi:hypothetical protein